jgi:IS30 family transposase
MQGRHLTITDREVIAKMLAEGESRTAIGGVLGFHRTSIGRELVRNASEGDYFPSRAQAAGDQRRADSKLPWKMDLPGIGSYVLQGLEQYWSPQEIAGRMKREYPDDPSMQISPPCIYAWIYRFGVTGSPWHTYLRRGHRRRRKHHGTCEKRGRIVGRVGIEHRPAEVEDKSRFGDWESDTIQGAQRRAYLATHVERKSQYLVMGKIADKRAATFNAGTLRAFARHPGLPCRTMTADNGKEFAAFGKLQRKLGLAVYFAEPYHSWQRGLNENTNGLLRQFFPKGFDLRGATHPYVAHVENLLNTRPRKSLGYRTPAEVLLGLPAP